MRHNPVPRGPMPAPNPPLLPLLRALLIVIGGLLVFDGCTAPVAEVSCEGSCAGCCVAGICHPGTDVTACGSGGTECSLCGSGQDCQAGHCVLPPNDCAACGGCCLNDKCHSGTSAAACGAGGSSCTVCPPGLLCISGACQRPWAACGADNCPTGCCQGDACISIPSNSQCGLGGGPCLPCTGGTECVGGECATKSCADCAAINGCCQNGTCYPGTSGRACGSGGQACTACREDQLCLAGVCKDLDRQKCNLGNCIAGCCGLDGCHMPYNDQFCGLGGLGCVACRAGETCSGGTCVRRTALCQSSCASGCCRGDSCIPITAQGDLLCGNQGEPCRACYGTQCLQGRCGGASTCPNCTGYNQCCAAGSCQLASTERCGRQGSACIDCSNAGGCNLTTGNCNLGGGNATMVCVASLRVNCSESGGSPACKPSVDASPEIRVVLALGTATGGTPDFNGSHDTSGAINAAWPNACPISGLTSSALTATPLSVQVYEVDAFISTKLIDVCQFQLTPQNITSGGWSGACGNFVSNLSLQFR